MCFAVSHIFSCAEDYILKNCSNIFLIKAIRIFFKSAKSSKDAKIAFFCTTSVAVAKTSFDKLQQSFKKFASFQAVSCLEFIKTDQIHEMLRPSWLLFLACQVDF